MTDYWWMKPDGCKVRCIPFDKIKHMFTHYPNPSSLSLPRDAYTNPDYRVFDEVYCLKLLEKGIDVYWANVYDWNLKTETPFMVLYKDEDGIHPLLIVAPPDFIISKYREEKIKETKRERKARKMRENLGI